MYTVVSKLIDVRAKSLTFDLMFHRPLMKRHYLDRFHTVVVDVHHIAGADDDESPSSGFRVQGVWMDGAGEKEESA